MPGSRLVVQAQALDDSANRERFRGLAADCGIPAMAPQIMPVPQPNVHGQLPTVDQIAMHPLDTDRQIDAKAVFAQADWKFAPTWTATLSTVAICSLPVPERIAARARRVQR